MNTAFIKTVNIRIGDSQQYGEMCHDKKLCPRQDFTTLPGEKNENMIADTLPLRFFFYGHHRAFRAEPVFGLHKQPFTDARIDRL